MGVKVAITEKNNKKVKPNYPYIGVSKNTYVLFTGPDSGISLDGGFLGGHLVDFWRESVFEPFDGAIELRNN